MRIKQCYMLPNMRSAFSYFFKEHSFKRYDDYYSPSIFFSLWQYNAIRKHKSLAVIIWRGTDILKLKNKLPSIKKMKNVYHVAISSYIENDLKKYDIKYKYIPIIGMNMEYFKPCKKGNEIYTYIPYHKTKKYHNRYGMEIVKKIKSKCKYKINIITSKSKYSKKELLKIYEKCFCSLRMTEHDGLPNQVIEMGLMGRKSFYNGDIPGSIKWSEDVDKIIDDIEIEAKKIGTIDKDYANKINKFINIDNKTWKNTNFWKE
jgi:hypothetical protein